MSSEMDDKALQSSEVKFTCPVCSAPMQTADAHVALARHPSVVRRYDLLSRDATLRTMPEWRSCPNCPGGGFSTPECLAPRHEELEIDATLVGWRCQGMMYAPNLAFFTTVDSVRTMTPLNVGVPAQVCPGLADLAEHVSAPSIVHYYTCDGRNYRSCAVAPPDCTWMGSSHFHRACFSGVPRMRHGLFA